ncbi:MAG: rane protein-like protein [Holophagaceae bacterium]|nr:rane protein-like protein [Holophagaceae bacterium]
MGGSSGCILALLLIVVVSGLIWLLIRDNRYQEALESLKDMRTLQGTVQAMRRQISELNDRLKRLEQGGVPVSSEPEAAPVPPPEPVALETSVPAAITQSIPVTAPDTSTEMPEATQILMGLPPVSVVAAEPVSTSSKKPAPLRPPPLAMVLPAPKLEPAASFDWETLVGVKLFSWVAGVALLVAAIAFLRYGVDHGWLTAPVRMSIGLIVGVGLLVVCETKRAQVYSITAHALTAGGIATLFATFFAAHALWGLIPSGVAFLLMVLVASVAVALSIRRDSLFVALLGLVGGFLTPALLSTGEDRPFALFGYLALLTIGLTWVARRKRWPILMALGMGASTLYQLGWVITFLDDTKLGIGVGVFLLFPILALGAVFLGRSDDEAAPDLHPLFRHTVNFAMVPPLLFALYFAATPAFGRHYLLMLGFLFLVAAGLALIALLRGPEWLHLLGGGSTLVVVAVWLGNGYSQETWPMVLVFLVLFVVLYLGASWLPTRWARLMTFETEGRWAIYTAPMMLFTFPVLLMLEPATASPGLVFGVLLGLMVLLAAYAIWFEDGLVYFGACFFVLGSEAVWSARYLDAKRLLPGLLIYGGFGLFYLGVPLVAQRWGRALKPRGSGAILAFASLVLLFFLTVGSIAQVSLWPLTILVVLLNLGLLHEASCDRYPVLSPLGMVLSWILMAVWWFNAPMADHLVPGLLALVIFALLGVAGSLWLKACSPSKSDTFPEHSGVFLGWVPHLFLLMVAAQPRLSLPPWPWLGVMLVLGLALGAAALYLRRGALLLGSAVLSPLVLMIWVVSVPYHAQGLHLLVGPWGVMFFAGLAYGFYELSRHLRIEDWTFPAAAGIGFLLAQLLLVVLCSTPKGATGEGLFLFANLVLALGLLTFAGRERAYGWALGLVASAGLVLLAWRFGPATLGLSTPQDHAWHLMRLAVPLYLIQLVFPLVLGPRARSERLPFLSAILASVVFFLFARPALMVLGCRDFIGGLPVIQALLLTPHLLDLLRLEPEGRRDLGRLAMVAGGILAFVTVAIPLQLEKQWITLGWALLGLALTWLYGRIPHKGLLAWTAGLMVAVFVRLVLNPSVFGYQVRSAVPIFNWYLYTYLVAAGCFFGAAWLLKDEDDLLLEGLPPLARLLPAGGTVILFLLLNIEIADFFSEGPRVTFSLFQGSLAQGLSYTIGWALFSIGMLTAGLMVQSRITRIAAILLLTVTVFKAFLLDLSSLSGLYRVASFVGLAASLAAVAVMLQQFVLRRSGESR